MDEGNQGFIKSTMNKIQAADKKRREAAKRRKRKKIILKLAPFLLWGFVSFSVSFLLLIFIVDFLDTDTALTSKQADASAVEYSVFATEESSPNRIIVDVNNKTSNGAYKLSYEFKDEDGNVLTSSEALENIKQDLLKENGNLDLSEFSNSELNIIGALMYNGLKVDKYNEEELKALVIFLKADIAGQSFDLRKKEDIGTEVELEDISNEDYVYGTLQVQRVKIGEDANGVLDYKEELLEYIEYGDETTPNTFYYMVENDDIEALNKFSINEEGELVIAQSSTTSTTYTYFVGDSNTPLKKEEAQAIIPKENLGENINQISVTEKAIDYKTRIAKYTANYGLLSDLLITTKNVDFCLELAQLALNSKIVININEETTKTHQIETAIYDQITLLYDYVKYEISGTKSNTSKNWSKVKSENGDPSDSTELSQYGWSSSMKPVRETGENGRTLYYEWWTTDDVNYQLKYINVGTYKNWTLYVEKENTTENSLVLEENDPIDGELIKNFEEETLENEPYTAKEELTYTIKTETNSETHRYTLEIGEVDTWSMKYSKKYSAPIEEPLPIPEGYETTGEFSELLESDVITDVTQIENDPHVQAFKEDRISTYKNKYGADEATCDFTELTIKQRVRTNVAVDYDENSSIITYKFGEEDANTTDVSWKNVTFINNKPEYTSYIEENGKEIPEIGFLYIYNKYITAGIDLYLQDDSETKLFELLETDPETSNSANIIRYFLFVYDGIDRGVTEFDLSIYKPSEFRSGAYGSGDIPLYTSLLTRDEFLAAMQEFSASGAGGNKTRFDKYFLSRADEIYTLGEKYQINPELIVVFAWKEQSFGDPVGDESNFWGLDVLNGQTGAPSYGTFEGGVEALAATFQSYNAGSGTWQEELIKKRYDERREYNPNGCGLPGTLRGAMSVYTCWLSEDRNYHEDGSAGSGGRYYLKVTYGDEYEAKCGSVHNDGEPYTTQEFADTAAYAYEQVVDKWKSIYGNYATITGGVGGITTQEEADALTEYYNELLNTVVHIGNEQQQTGPFAKWWTSSYNGGLDPFQCTWWAFGRASMYLEEYGSTHTKYPTARGHGKDYYDINIEGGWFNYGDTPKPNSVLSWQGGQYGHVLYVEGVTEDGIWVSDAGSGNTWRGVRFMTNEELAQKNINGYIYLDEPL